MKEHPTPVHVRLSQKSLDALKAKAERELLPVATMARILLQRALERDGHHEEDAA
jgi:predicted DNA binding CopG/RHH family protein